MSFLGVLVAVVAQFWMIIAFLRLDLETSSWLLRHVQVVSPITSRERIHSLIHASYNTMPLDDGTSKLEGRQKKHSVLLCS